MVTASESPLLMLALAFTSEKELSCVIYWQFAAPHQMPRSSATVFLLAAAPARGSVLADATLTCTDRHLVCLARSGKA